MKKLGFTLIELLIVITIMGILLALILPNLASARARARDSRRKMDLSSLQQSLRLYYSDNQSFPAIATLTSLWGSALQTGSTVYMSVLPRDPSTVPGSPINYGYYTDVNRNTYIIVANLENLSDLDIAGSQLRCPNTYAAYTPKAVLSNYVVCEE